MRTIRVLAAAGVCALAACGGSDPTGAGQPVAPAAQTTEAVTPKQQAYLDELEKIDPGLVVKTSRALDRAGYVCDHIDQGDTNKQLVYYTREMLSGGNATINDAQAKKVIKLVKKYICNEV
jgi:hypothetical protein